MCCSVCLCFLFLFYFEGPSLCVSYFSVYLVLVMSSFLWFPQWNYYQFVILNAIRCVFPFCSGLSLLLSFVPFSRLLLGLRIWNALLCFVALGVLLHSVVQAIFQSWRWIWIRQIRENIWLLNEMQCGKSLNNTCWEMTSNRKSVGKKCTRQVRSCWIPLPKSLKNKFKKWCKSHLASTLFIRV